MEVYLLIALIFIYFITTLTLNKTLLCRIWTLAFIGAFICTAVSIVFLHISNQDVMISADNLNWYYFLYVFGSISVALGLINIWLYKRQLWHIIHPSVKDTPKE